MNQVILIGRLCHKLELKEFEENKNELDLVLAVTRSFKNDDGIYETDFINCKVFGNMTNRVVEYCKKGDMLGIKGRLQIVNNMLYVIAEKVTFLTSKNNN